VVTAIALVGLVIAIVGVRPREDEAPAGAQPEPAAP
jgi:hypothetical protein